MGVLRFSLYAIRSPRREQRLLEDVVRDLGAELLSGRLVGAEVLAGVDAAEACFVCRCAEAREGAGDAGERGRLRRELERIAVEERGEHVRGGRADRGVRPGVGG